MVNGERLESEKFQMPADSGVRVLLIAGGEAVSHGVDGPPPASPIAELPVPAASPSAPAVGAPVDGVRVVQVTVVALTLLAFAAIFVQQWRRTRGR
jgi:hypothetical protein